MSDQPKKQTFCIVYDGSEHANHEMKIQTLGRTLTNLGSILEEANGIINETDEGLDVKVNANFIEGSFGYEVEIFQHLVNAIDILPVLGFTGGIASVMGALDWLQGKSIDKVIEQEGKSKIISEGHELSCSPVVAKLVANSKLRSSFDQLIRVPLQSDGTDTFKVKAQRDDLEPVIEFDKDSSHSFVKLKIKDVIKEDKFEKRVKFIAANISQKHGWKVKINDAIESVRMEDEGFMERLSNMKEAHIFGKTFNVRLIRYSSANIEGKEKYTIEHVFIGSEK